MDCWNEPVEDVFGDDIRVMSLSPFGHQNVVPGTQWRPYRTARPCRAYDLPAEASTAMLHITWHSDLKPYEHRSLAAIH